LVVLQLYLWEVTLNKDNATGINWKNFSFPQFGGTKEAAIISGLTGFSSVASPGVSLGATLSGKINAEAVLQFLSKQGQVQTVSNPQLTFVSGSSAEFRVGGKQRYISEVGTLTNSVSGSTSSSSNNTVSTDSLDTGLTVDVGGVFESGIISAVMNLELQDVISMNQTTTESGVTIDLPETSERKVSTSLRVRPGDNLVLAGLVTSRDTNDRDGIPFFGASIPMYGRDQLKNSELVVLVKPSVVLFAESSDVNAPPKKDKKKKPMDIEAVMIDKDGAKPIRIPDEPSMRYAPVAALPEVKPELMVPATTTEKLSSVPITPGSDKAPVDKQLLQRGFSHAFDELQEPVPLVGKPIGGVP
jgi:type II secretory pathway component GspD/PulD (secretin)